MVGLIESGLKIKVITKNSSQGAKGGAGFYDALKINDMAVFRIHYTAIVVLIWKKSQLRSIANAGDLGIVTTTCIL